MSSSPQGLEANRRGGKLVPALCNIFGTLILVSVIALYLPITLAHARGYEVYNVVSGSMEPAIPVGSVIYVETLRAEDVAEGDVVFNYRLKEGKATTRNAIKLLELMGYDRDVIERATAQAEHFAESGVWQNVID